MKKVYVFISIVFLFVTIYALSEKMIFHYESYQEEYQEKVTTTFLSLSTPRGRILDCNEKILVDNVGVKTIVYRKVNHVTTESEIDIAYKLADILSFSSKGSLNDYKRFWMLQHKSEADKLITEEEYALLAKRKLTTQDLYLLKLDRITEEILSDFSELDKKASFVYSLMNSGYRMDAKIIKMDVSEEEYAKVLESRISGISNEMYFKREYPYGNTLKSLFGSIGRIPEEEKEFYLSQGYALDDLVGISYLEKEYDEFLRGEKDVYKVGSDGVLEKVTDGKRGSDLILSIDIDMQLGIEEILKREIKNGKALQNTEYYNGSYVVVGNPQTGGIKAIAGLKYLGDDVFKNVESDVVNFSFTVGSVVKGASMAMAYQNNLVDVGKKVYDSCVKLYLVPEKCSYKRLGYVDDITALKTSSNYYQFLLVIKLAGQKYSYNMKMNVTEREFSIYRDAFHSFGLGVKTGIDLPNETVGIKGSTIAPDLLLNFAIGQYDTYTPLQLLQYINTIANSGERLKISLMDKIKDSNGSLLLEKEKTVLNTFDLERSYFERIQTGFYQVVNLGTGVGYVDKKFSPAGKTGTSEVYYDSNHDGKGDVLTVTNTFAMYAPSDNPKYSLVVVSPNVHHYNGSTDYFAYINRYISKAVSDYVLGNY